MWHKRFHQQCCTNNNLTQLYSISGYKTRVYAGISALPITTLPAHYQAPHVRDQTARTKSLSKGSRGRGSCFLPPLPSARDLWAPSRTSLRSSPFHLWPDPAAVWQRVNDRAAQQAYHPHKLITSVTCKPRDRASLWSPQPGLPVGGQ